MKNCNHDNIQLLDPTSDTNKRSEKRRRPAWLTSRGWLTAALAAIIGFMPVFDTIHAESYSAKVYASSLNVRSEPAADAKIKGSVKEGSVVTVLDEQYGWMKIQTERLTGWVAGYYLKKVTVNSASSSSSSKPSPSNANNSSVGTVTADSLRIRSGPGTGYEVVGSLKEHNTVTILSSSSGWLKVKTSNGITGWVSDDYVALSGSSTISGETTSGSSSTHTNWDSLRGKTIVVDAGHGGDDPGTVGSTHGTLEKEINLQTAMYLRDYLRDAGAHVTMTRTKDNERPSLSSRAQLSQSVSADAFISIHYNSSPKKVSGTLTFFYSESGDLNLAQAIENRLGNGVNLKSNGVSFGDFHVLRENSAPATLVELGFLTHPTDESIVRGTSYQKKAAKAIAQGLADYFTQ